MAFVEVTKQGNVGIITMNRPEALNALSSAVFADLTKALDVVEHDDEIYVVVITGAGRAFVAGADIGEMATMNVEEGLAFSELGNNLMMRVDLFSKPTIAAVNGFALGGGCELALAADIRIASEKAKFGQPEVGLGIIPGFGGTQRMARIIGTGAAMELIYTADT
ncbi:MAG: enoyl-CoA hydratase/isomerase family protein, partial [Ruminiclostridium sp.]|nr:enoyl-CoA hydratase/isomerase family protein [Ruminiclostridium sp.]